MNTQYQVIAISKYCSESFFSRAEFLNETDAESYKKILLLRFNSSQTKLLYKEAVDRFQVEFFVVQNDEGTICASSLAEGLTLLSHDFEKIQQYLEEVIFEFLHEQLSGEEPVMEDHIDDNLPNDYPRPLVYWGSTPIA